MENNEFFSLFPEFRFEEKIEKPLELNLHANSVVSMNALNTVIANAIEKSKLGKAGSVKLDIFSSPALVEKVCYDDILSPLCDVPSYDDMFEEYALRNSYSLACDDTVPLVYDGYDDKYNIFSSPTFEEKTSYDYNMPPIFDDYVMRIIILLNLLLLLLFLW
jgi:hypothetical protein